MINTSDTRPDSTNILAPQVEKLDEQFLEAVSEHIQAYYNTLSKTSPVNSLPENQKLTFLLKEVREKNDINARDDEGNILLSLVATTSEVELFRLLLSHPNIDVNTQDNRKTTPLMKVIFKGETMGSMLQAILAHPALDTEIRNNFGDGGSTALMLTERYLESAKENKNEWEIQAFTRAIELIQTKQAEIQTSERVIHATETAIATIQDGLIPEIEWTIMEAESPDNQEMIRVLNKLQSNLEPALKLYEELSGKTFDNISGITTFFGEGYVDETLKTETVDIRAIFSGLHEPDVDSHVCLNTLAANVQEEAPLFRELLRKFMEKNSEDQASMLQFFELVNSYVILRNDQKWLLKNPLKKILFSENTASYKEWILAIFNAFEENPLWMAWLIKSIQEAEAPNTPLPWKSIRTLFPTNPEIFEEADQIWLRSFYEKYPDVTTLSQLIKELTPEGIEAKKQVTAHNELNKKYTLLCGPEGTASEEAKKMAQELISSVKQG